MPRILRTKIYLLTGAMVAATIAVGAPAIAQKGGKEQQLQGELNSRSPKSDGNAYQVRTMALEAGKRYGFSAETDDFDPTLRISFADDNDEPIAEDDDGGEGTNSYIEFAPERTGTYRLRVASIGSGTGAYVLKMRDLPPLPAPVRPTSTGTSTITFKHFAGALAETDGEVRGRLVDDYVMRFEAGKQVFLFLDSASEDFDPLLEVYSPGKRSSSTPFASDDDGGDGMNAFITFTPEESGEYMLRATSSGSEREPGRYTLRVGQ